MKPSNFTNFPIGSIANKCENEIVAQNIMIILERTGNKFRKLSWREYKKERLNDKRFSEGEKSFFNSVIEYCTSANKAKLFNKAWNQIES